MLGPNGAGKTTTLETCEGYRTPQQGTVRVLGLDPVRDRRDLLPRIGVMLQGGGAWSGVARDGDARPHRPAARPPARHRRCSPTGSASATAAGRRTAGSRAASSSGSGWRWRSSAGPRSSSSTSRRPGMDPQARRTTWELLEELRGDGVTVVLTTHYMDEAERLADQIHIIDHGRLIASGRR